MTHSGFSLIIDGNVNCAYVLPIEVSRPFKNECNLHTFKVTNSYIKTHKHTPKLAFIDTNVGLSLNPKENLPFVYVTLKMSLSLIN
jgi:hypothetical protein